MPYFDIDWKDVFIVFATKKILYVVENIFLNIYSYLFVVEAITLSYDALIFALYDGYQWTVLEACLSQKIC